MKFKTIIIENLFSYEGQVVFDFNNTEKPITLIIGENGFGKTSFINSVKIALHGIGKDLLNIGAQKLSKQDFILGNPDKHFSGILNRNARNHGINEAIVKIEIDDDEIIKIERRFTIHTSSYSETLLIFNGDGELIAENDEAQDIINAKISPTMAQFFFFDGEKIQTIADFSHEEFTKMLEDVLELDIYDQAIKDSEEMIRRTIKNELDSDIKNQVTNTEKELEEVTLNIEKYKDNLTQESLKLKSLESEFKKIEKKLNKLKSRHKKSLDEANEKLESLKQKEQKDIEKFKQITLVQLPMLLNPKLLNQVKSDIDNNYKGRVQIDTELLNKKKEELLEKLSTNIENVAKAFDEVFKPSDVNQSVSFADPYRVEKQFNALPEIDLKSLLERLSKTKVEIKEVKNEIEELEQKIALEKKDYEDDVNKSKDLLKEIGHQKAICENIENKIIEAQKRQKILKSELSKLTISEHKNELINKKIEIYESIIKVAKEMKKKIKKEKRKSLEQSINEKFHYLKKEGYEADKIILDNDFKINIYDKFDNPMDILSSSSGQKQIIATALIWGISEYISEEIPMIIDTPLGRLDDKNQTLILKEFYPNASKQVIILPTPSELKHEGFKTIQDSINEIFVLRSAGSSTTVTKKDSLEQFFQHYQPSLPLIEESA
jgi:DNA sulfur modification protein DndD